MGFKLIGYLLVLLNISYLLWQFHLGKIILAQPQVGNQSSILLVGEYLRAQRGVEILPVMENQSQTGQVEDLDGMLESLQRRVDISAQPGIRHGNTKNTLIRSEHLVNEDWRVKRVCRQSGYFPDQASLQHWLDNTPGAYRQIFHQNIEVEKDYQVYYPAAKSLSQSQQDKAILLQQGYLDVWRISGGDLQGGYSLGVFSDKQRAINLKNQLASKRIQAEIHVRKAINAQWFARLWLDEREAVAVETLAVCDRH